MGVIRHCRQVALALLRDLERVYLGTSPRSSINGTTYVHTAADFDPHRTVPVHLEMSFRSKPPATQMFFANKVDQWKGGETPLTDFRGVWEQLRENPEWQLKFGNGKVKYIRNMDDCSAVGHFDPLVQKCWQKMFKDEKDVMQKCADEDFNCTWGASNKLTLSNVQPFVRKHPITGDEVWFNHINVLHKDSMAADYARTSHLWGGLVQVWPLALSFYYRALFGLLDFFVPEKELGSTAVFENGEVFSKKELSEMKAAIHANTIQHAYAAHDVVLVDNLRVGHGREIYLGGKGSRQIFTAWSNEYPQSWQQDAVLDTQDATLGDV